MNAKIWGAIAVALVLGACGAKKDEAADAAATACRCAAAADAAALLPAALLPAPPPPMPALLLPTLLRTLRNPLPTLRRQPLRRRSKRLL
jgi:hypothetical protein